MSGTSCGHHIKSIHAMNTADIREEVKRIWKRFGVLELPNQVILQVIPYLWACLIHQILYSLTVEAWVRSSLFCGQSIVPCLKDGCSPWIRAMQACFSLWDITLWAKQEFTKHWRIGALCLLLLEPCHTQYVNKPRPAIQWSDIGWWETHNQYHWITWDSHLPSR